MQPDQQSVKRWSDVAPFWDKHRGVIRKMFAPVTKALAEDGMIGSGHAVLDIATGPGEPALSIASLVGPEGRVCGIDYSSAMVEAARREAGRLGLRNTEFHTSSAEKLHYPSDTFDVAVSRFGAMFFPSPMDGVREILRVLKPGGRLALAVWGPAEKNPFFNVTSRIVDRFVDSPPAPGAPDAFLFANPGILRRVLGEAGAQAPTERMLKFAIEAPISAEDYWTVRSEISESLRSKLAALSKDQTAEVKRLAIEAFRGYSTDRGISFHAEVLIVSGNKRRPS